MSVFVFFGSLYGYFRTFLRGWIWSQTYGICTCSTHFSFFVWKKTDSHFFDAFIQKTFFRRISPGKHFFVAFLHQKHFFDAFLSVNTFSMNFSFKTICSVGYLTSTQCQIYLVENWNPYLPSLSAPTKYVTTVYASCSLFKLSVFSPRSPGFSAEFTTSVYWILFAVEVTLHVALVVVWVVVLNTTF